MTKAFCEVAGARVTRGKFLIGANGPWVAELDFETDPALSGAVEIVLGSLTLRGTVAADASGAFGLVTHVRIVGGANAWGTVLAPKGYHNDAGVRALLVAQDAARACGETLGAFLPRASSLGIDYARGQLPASRALEDAAGGASWWVGYDGVTQVGTRATNTPPESAYEVQAYNPLHRQVQLHVDDPAVITVGSILTKGLPSALTVRELEIEVTSDTLSVNAWCGDGDGQLLDVFRRLVARVTDASVFGVFRYRVVSMVADRVQLQAVRKVAGRPDLLPLSMWPGVAGCHAVLTPGAEVLVQFVEGDPAMPIVTHFAGKDGQGFVPVSIVIGGPVGLPAARQTDPVQVTLPPAVFTGTINGLPASGSVVWAPPAVANGTIVGGSAKVSIA